jgi:hypothetical protein
MKRWSLWAVAVALAVALAFPAALAVGQTPSPGASTTPAPAIPSDQTIVRAVHAVAGAGAVNVVSSPGNPVFCNLAFKGVTRYVATAPGPFSFDIAPVSAAAGPGATGTPATPTAEMTASPAASPTVQATATGAMTPTTQATGAMTPTTGVGGPGPGPQARVTQTPGATPGAGMAIVSGSVNLAGGQAYSLVAVGQPGNVETLSLTDDISAPPAGKAKVRFVHASPDTPAVDVTVAGTAIRLFSNVGYKSASDYAVVDAGTVNLEVSPTGTANVMLTVPNVTLSSGAVYTIYAVGLSSGQPALQPLLTVESVGGLPVPSNPTS